MSHKPGHKALQERLENLEKELASTRLAMETHRENEKRYRLIVESLSEGVIPQEASGRIVIWNKSAEQVFGIPVQEHADRKAEQELLREAVRRRILVEQSQDGIVVIDQNGKVHEANPKFANMLGYTLAEVRELCVWDWDSQWEREQLLEMIEQVDETGDSFETRHRRKDGTLYDVEISTNGTVFEGQKMVFCVCRDITERKQAEMILRESKSRLQALSDASFEAIFFFDGGVCIDQNNTAERIFGYTYDEAIGRSGTAWIVAQDRELISRHMLSGYEKPYQVTALRKDGTTFPAEIQGRMITYQDRLMRVTALRDISEQKRAEQALRESEERFRRLFEEAPVAIQGYAPDGTIHYWNKANEKTYGYSGPEAVGKNLLDLIIPDEMRAIAADIIKKGAETGEMPPPVEFSLKRKDGSSVPVLSAHVAIKHASKQAELYCLDSDLTEQKQLQAELQQAHKMEVIGTLTGGIAHDFNNILGIIIGNCELALDNVPDWNPAHFNLKEIIKAGLRAKDIVRQLLTFCRRSEHQPKAMHLIPGFKDVLRFIRATIPATIEIRHEISAAQDTILAESTVIYQVMMNLCSNAAQAMEMTGGTIMIRVQNVCIDKHQPEIPSLKSGQFIRITVADTGPGIAPEIIDRIFDPYFTTKSVGKGTGMGLAVVQGIAKSHGGTVSVQSEPGAGATFSVYFPLTDESVQTETARPNILQLGNETILFVDDEKSIVDMGQEMLTRLGYSVEKAMTPLEALEKYRSDPKRFDLVITDMTMPQMTGLQLTKNLKAINPNVRVILCTGFSAYITPEKAEAMGIKGYLMKPIVKLEMASLVRKVLDDIDCA